MFVGIPRTPFLLALAGAIPFLWGGLTYLRPEIGSPVASLLGARFVGASVLFFYGVIILSFMSGVLWGFAAKADYAVGYALSVLPALWGFFMTGSGPTAAATNLIVGFLAVLMLDWHFWNLGMTPPWWFKLRVIITAFVVVSFLPVVI
ncbi:Protein of unknown function [Cognatiyoonia koreensis]|uniref:DUF3429 domain-containing protein n=1 Tax=Cognatiyoonia koreensis TaxID=364200 RepID=A0A1I0RXQ9_9RHOB|nr:DUF3429 domain-containing protein [Cognatiyoonia koreensis]SEW46280.1 Protein of unknown function [Cognatiyoonia koreensis]